MAIAPDLPRAARAFMKQVIDREMEAAAGGVWPMVTQTGIRLQRSHVPRSPNLFAAPDLLCVSRTFVKQIIHQNHAQHDQR